MCIRDRCGSVLDAVLEERKLEFGGEGIRRYDLIRNNKLGAAIDLSLIHI